MSSWRAAEIFPRSKRSPLSIFCDRICRIIRIRVVNVVDLMTLQPQSEHPHGISDADFDAIFTTNKPIVFAFHAYPYLIHRLTYRRKNHDNLHVRGYKEEGTTTTPFDMTVMNDIDRFHLAGDVIDRVPRFRDTAGASEADAAEQADRPQALHLPIRRRYAGNQKLEMAGVERHRLKSVPPSVCYLQQQVSQIQGGTGFSL